METLKSIKFDVNRIILQLLIPGIFSAIPFFLVFINANEECRSYFSHSEGTCTTLLVIVSLTVGLILEDLGSLIEYEFDKRNKKKYLKEGRDIDEEWKEYLKLKMAEDCDSVGQRYLRTIIIRMKFELSFCVSLIIMTVGLIFLNVQIGFVNNWFRFSLICIVIPVTISLYLLWEAKNSTELLIKVRKWILEK